ncbi:CocE/NonD family hydrolase [Ponticaulis sp.]|uniref:CocE/NonD family hydrolase n=1 Tax=Ponticaulis sp. TaxID=2020902 RepID=UPI000B7395F1|nr:CocE/NonD family hydrolase [Ponticaulis sp.]MAI91212.1 hypothetical protein [Ponticaulis sp.]OUX98525.1 MAG: hypothetical protein CBB65_12260 [Hyphomonadaceae bacterium TMED5]|tara:strand:+ start:74288 stop:76105 length:1818 start_codon:yes stop_codon:yes gene_type:complete
MTKHLTKQHSASRHAFRTAVSAFALVGLAATLPSAQAEDTSWASYELAPPIEASDIETWSEYVTMPDGTQIAVTVYLPADRAEDETFPSLVRITRYLRAVYGQPLESMIPMRRYVGNGYAYVAMDVRGTGASTGRWSVPWSPEEVADYDVILDWIAAQDWSNGDTGTLGGSYEGGAAEMAATTGNDTLRAVMPMFSAFDVFADVSAPGGVRNSSFFERWTGFNSAIDANAYDFTVLPVDDVSLPAAITSHQYNGNIYDTVMAMHFRDDYVIPDAAIEADKNSPHAYIEELEASGLPFYGLTGWYDSSFLTGSIKRFLTIDTPGSRLTIGPWKHGAPLDVTPRGGNPATSFDLVGEAIRYFDEYLADVDTGMDAEAPVHYYTMVENAWKAADTWPPEAETETLYFGDDAALSDAACEGALSDAYTVDYSTGTTLASRWGMLAVDPMALDNIHPEGSPVLSYTAPPLSEDTEVTGHPEIFLYLTSDQADGQFFVYLEDVAPDGSAAYVTEGVLAGIQRQTSEAPYETVGPYHSFLQEDAAILSEDEPVLLNFSMFPTSYLFQEGHSIRIVLTGADVDNFEPPETPPANWDVYRCSEFPTRVELPVIR